MAARDRPPWRTIPVRRPARAATNTEKRTQVHADTERTECSSPEAASLLLKSFQQQCRRMRIGGVSRVLASICLGQRENRVRSGGVAHEKPAIGGWIAL